MCQRENQTDTGFVLYRIPQADVLAGKSWHVAMGLTAIPGFIIPFNLYEFEPTLSEAVMADVSLYVLPPETKVALLDCQTAFNGLTDQERLYAHYISQASWYGGLICLIQTSPESPGIYLLISKLFRCQKIEELQSAAEAQGITKEEYQAFLTYVAGFLSNSGNYKSFGDSKIIPNLPKEKFEKILMSSKAAKEIQGLWQEVSERVYSLVDRQRELGLGKRSDTETKLTLFESTFTRITPPFFFFFYRELRNITRCMSIYVYPTFYRKSQAIIFKGSNLIRRGTTSYYSDNCDLVDAKVAQEFMSSKDISPYNTRLFKTQEGEQDCYEVRLASSSSSGGDLPGVSKLILGSHDFTPKETGKPCIFKVTRGDYSDLMALVLENLTKAVNYAANETEKKMLNEYINSFTTGSIPQHKEGSRHWIQNKGPIVETYIGFIESYRDPFGVRGEFEGFVAVVNKEMSAKFTELVNQAEHLLPLLPWPAAFEKDKFLRPDFTSLDVLTFGGSGIPAGINIPNYEDIRQDEGFKNVSLGNVLIAGYKEDKVNFLDEKDQELFLKLQIPSFEVLLGLHELLGHGSGKFFIKHDDGTYNFDKETVVNPETNEKITQCYNENETWDSKFSTISSSYEECRAECVGIYLCLSTDVLKIFGFTGDSADDVIYISWLTMARAGLLALEFYSPETRAWRQPHMQASFCILRVMLEASQGLVTITKTTGEDGKDDILLKLNRSKITSVGKPAIGNFLRKLQVYKSLGDVESGKKMYDYYSDVHDRDEPHFLSLRSIVLQRKQPRRMFVQHNTVVKGTTVELRSYDATAAGLIQSWIERFPEKDIEHKMMKLWEKEKPYFTF
ncbi:dipeptidyl peptidase 3-like [Ostrea edulis]|uniref:dipeptidyl peptidase 3-like n=1 Tax=Ostrea edulis TaxID=37623 RepID=UPI0024AF12C3|nr:dipeptidyl peptidase 3-like [Ostrea edulis]